MSTPFYDIPNHFKIGMDSEGRGPVMEHETNFHHYGCWCGDDKCVKYKEKNDDPRD